MHVCFMAIQPKKKRNKCKNNNPLLMSKCTGTNVANVAHATRQVVLISILFTYCIFTQASMLSSLLFVNFLWAQCLRVKVV